MTLKRNQANEIIFSEAKWTPYGTIECLVELESTGELIPFNASGDDDVDYGRELFELLSTERASEVASCSQDDLDAAAIYDVLERRSQELKGSDWTQFPDVPQSTRELWAPYRQALRDITDQEGYPHEVVWPTRPS